MNGILQTLLSYLLLYKYLTLFVITYFGALLLPLPSGSLVMAASAFATQGYMNIGLVWLVAVVGNVAGDNTGYFIARRYGPATLRKIGFKKIIASSQNGHLRTRMERHPFLIIFTSRYMTSVAPAINLVAGFLNFTYSRFLLFEVLGEITEVSTTSLIGYIFGSNWQYFNGLLGKLWILVVAGILFSFYFLKILTKHPKNKPEQ